MNIGEMELAQRIYKKISATKKTGEPITINKSSLDLTTANVNLFSFVPKLSGDIKFDATLQSSKYLVRAVVSVYENNQKIFEQTYNDGDGIEVLIDIKPYREYLIAAKKAAESDAEGDCILLFPTLEGYAVDDISRYIAIE